MSGIYIHIPFCKKACHYCDFHFSTQLDGINNLVDAIIREISLTKTYLADRNISTIYFGGGTPSLLSVEHFNDIFLALREVYDLSNVKEVTVEINPENYNPEFISGILKLGVNRFSVGIQTFDNDALKWMNRSHIASQSIAAIKGIQSLGIDNISIDLIYGLPSSSHAIWEQDLITAMELRVNHISAYCLTIEQDTVFGRLKNKNKMKFASEDFEIVQFEMLKQTLVKNNFEQYEISNFCKKDSESIHNTNYWKGVPYLGLGPSAHSYNITSRQWNVKNNEIYIRNILSNNIPCESEQIDDRTRVNEYILTSLRTKWGIDLSYLEEIAMQHYGSIKDHLQKYEGEKMILINNHCAVLTAPGQLLADHISAELFI